MPYESPYHQKPSIYHHRPDGTKCFVQLPEEKCQPETKLMPLPIEQYLIGYIFSDKIYRKYIPSQHKVIEAQQIHWPNKTIAPLGTTTMELLLAEETYATVYPLSCPLPLRLKSKQTRNETDKSIHQHLRNLPYRKVNFLKLASL